MRLFPLLMLLTLSSLAAAQPTPTAAGGGSGLIVSGIAVDVGGKGAADARRNGWRQAQRLAWPRLWARVTGEPDTAAPALGDGALDGIVSAIEVEREQVSAERYVARLAIVFDRVRTSRYLGSAGGLTRSPPLLLLPLVQDAGVRQAYEAESPWLAAWARLRPGETPIDYVRINPTQGDIILLSAWSARRDDLDFWRDMVSRYQVADVVIPELILDRTFAGGPVNATLIVRAGTAGRELGRATLRNAAGDVAGMLDVAVRQADAIYGQALRDGRLRADPALLQEVTVVESDAPRLAIAAPQSQGIELRVATPDDAAAARAEAVLRAAGAGGVRLVALNVGGESVLTFVAPEGFDGLRYRLDQAGFTLAEDVSGLLLRPRQAGDPRVEPPVRAPVEGAIEGAAPASVAPDAAAAAAASPTPAPPVAAPSPAPKPAPASPLKPTPAPPASGPRHLLPPGR